MSTDGFVYATSPAEALLALAQKYESDIQAASTQAASGQTAPIIRLDLLSLCKDVAVEYYRNHHNSKAASEPSIANILKPHEIAFLHQPQAILYSQGVYTIRDRSAAVVIPLLKIGSLECRAKSGQESVEVQLEKGSVIYLAGGAMLEMRGDGQVVCIFLLFKAT
ncbi:MAG: hypothetical protein M1839_004362 [Geoglossum umbratile]|nr:MAG: hypothetical protein M1839_004362 [Geoglossum umbratile]